MQLPVKLKIKILSELEIGITLLTVKLCGESLLWDCDDVCNRRLSSTGTIYGRVDACVEVFRGRVEV